MLTFIIIPIYNESQVVYKLLQNEIFKNYQLILVNDGSRDEFTVNKINFPFYFLQHSKNMGQGAALQTGMEFAKMLHADIVVHFDADGQHDPFDIETLTEPIKLGEADVVIGSRFIKKYGKANHSKIPFSKKIILQCARFIQFLYAGINLTDSQNGLRAISGNALSSIIITENRMAHAIELIHIFKKKKWRIKEVPVNISYSSYSSKKGQKLYNGVLIVAKLLVNKMIRYMHVTAFSVSFISGIAFSFFIEGKLLLLAAIIFLCYLLTLCILAIIIKRKGLIISRTKMIRNHAIQNFKKIN